MHLFLVGREGLRITAAVCGARGQFEDKSEVISCLNGDAHAINIAHVARRQWLRVKRLDLHIQAFR